MRWLRALIWMVVLTSASLSLLSGAAAAETHVGGAILVNTTWTMANSPYVVDSQVSVAAGATLTIQPGVEIQFAGGPYVGISVSGGLVAEGTSSNGIRFTSTQGATGAGAPGQWKDLTFKNGAVGSLSYVTVEYGGTGGALPAADGAIRVSGSAIVGISESTIAHNEASGLLALSTNRATITRSSFLDNGLGVSISGGGGGVVTLTDSTVAGNSTAGVFANLGSTSGQTIITHNDITGNEGAGVQLQISGSLPASLYPTGTGNNIWDNDVKDLAILYQRYDVSGLWDGNYWGPTASGPAFCPWASTPWMYHVYFSDSIWYPQSGPVTSRNHSSPSNSLLTCATDFIPVATFSQTPIPNDAP